MNATQCSYSAAYNKTAEIVFFFSYFALAPTYVLFGLCGHGSFLLASYVQSKTEPAYTYQILLVSSETAEIVCTAFFCSSFHWSRFTPVYWSCSVCVWYTAHAAAPLSNAFVTITLLLSTAIAVDRILALRKPFSYKLLNHRKIRAVVAIGCSILGISSSAFDCWRFSVVTKIDQSYGIAGNLDFINSSTANILAQTRNALRAIGLSALITANCVLLVSYRRRLNQIGQMFNKADKMEAERRKNEKVLTLITICQCGFTCLSTTVLISYYVLIYAKRDAIGCYGSLMGNIVDATFMLADLGKFYTAFGISREVRKIILKPLTFWKKPRVETTLAMAIISNQ